MSFALFPHFIAIELYESSSNVPYGVEIAVLSVMMFYMRINMIWVIEMELEKDFLSDFVKFKS